MIELDGKKSQIPSPKARDEMLREAILASVDKTGEPNEYFIINYLIEKLLPGEALLTYLNLPARKRNLRARGTA